jgi:L-asparaginase II
MSPDEPLIEIVRGPLVESRHTGAIAVADDTGRRVFVHGEVTRPVFPRSAIKAIQALLLVESGAAERFGFGDQELALACASHSGEPEHVATAAGMLARVGLSENALECGAHWPGRADAAYALARTGERPRSIHNNCSGKHSGFLALSVHRGVDPAGYVAPDHPVQVDVRGVVEDLVGMTLGSDVCGTDGCSIPTYALPLDKLAAAFARFGTGRGLAPERAAAAKRLREACAAAPQMVAGTGRFCTDIMRMFRERVFVKTGAEGVFCGFLADTGLGVALKCNDGAPRAAEAMMAAIIERYVPMSNEERVAFQRWLNPDIRNWRGIRTGEVRVSAALRAALGIRAAIS